MLTNDSFPKKELRNRGLHSAARRGLVLHLALEHLPENTCGAQEIGRPLAASRGDGDSAEDRPRRIALSFTVFDLAENALMREQAPMKSCR
jgi:hypothetical protein